MTDDDKNVFPLSKIPSSKARAAAKVAPPVSGSGSSQAAEREFIQAARTHSVPAGDHADWRSLDPEERPTRGINVRFNEYELALLRHLAKVQDRSIHQVIKRLLVPAALKALEE